MDIHRAPPILILHLNRFKTHKPSYRSKKIQNRVNFPTRDIDLSKFMSNFELEKEDKGTSRMNDFQSLKLLYDLFGVTNYYGGTGSGHYTAFTKNFMSEEWYYFDDEDIRNEEEQNICTRAAYVLFYRRKDSEFKMPHHKSKPVG